MTQSHIILSAQDNKTRWDFDRDKKKLAEILQERDGFWCRLCGYTDSLSIHHIHPRGRIPPNFLINGEYYRDDPRNLCFLCMQCHDFVHNNPLAAERLGVLKKETV